MTFLQPWMLFGLLAASVPIIIHLINRSRPRRQPFAAIELLLESAKRVDRRWKLQRILLLASRVVLLALLAFAAARPAPIEEAKPAAAAGPRRVGIVVDASASMQARYGAGSALDGAKKKARRLMDQLGPRDLAVVVRAGPEAALATPQPTADRRSLRRAIDELAPSFGRSDLGRAVTLAVRALDPGETAEPMPVEIAVLSDWTESALQTPADPALQAGGRARVELVDAVAEARTDAVDNLAITSVQSEPVPGGRARSLRWSVRTRSFGEPGGPVRPVALDLLEDGEPFESTMTEVAPGTIADDVVEHTFESAGTKLVTLRLAPDRLDVDDRFHTVAQVRHRVRTLVVDGDPSGVAKEDEVFYFDKAARTGLADHPVPRIITADELEDIDLSAWDVVVLAGLVSISPAEGARLTRHVEAGGGLLIAAGEAIDPPSFNANLEALPRPIRGLKISAEVAGSRGPVRFEPPDLEHPIFRVFQGEGRSGLSATETRGILLFEPGGERTMAVPLRYTGGQPAMITAPIGSGRVAIWTSTLDRDLTDFPIRPAFVPWVRRTVLWLGKGLHETDERRTLVGETRVIRAPEGTRAVRVKTPSGPSIDVDVTGRVASFRATDVPGHYRVFGADGRELSEEHFAVNVDTAESDLDPLSREEAELLLVGGAEKLARTVSVRQIAGDDGWSEETWVTLLLALMALTFLFESLLTTRRIGRA